MFAAGSRAEVTAPFKHANLPRFNLLLFFLASGLLKMRKKGLGEPLSGSLKLHLGRKWGYGAMGRQRLLLECKTGRLCSANLQQVRSHMYLRLHFESFFFFYTETSLTETAARLQFCSFAWPLSFLEVRYMKGNSAWAISQIIKSLFCWEERKASNSEN